MNMAEMKILSLKFSFQERKRVIVPQAILVLQAEVVNSERANHSQSHLVKKGRILLETI